jgi:hypothetical protein
VTPPDEPEDPVAHVRSVIGALSKAIEDQADWSVDLYDQKQLLDVLRDVSLDREKCRRVVAVGRLGGGLLAKAQEHIDRAKANDPVHIRMLIDGIKRRPIA